MIFGLFGGRETPVIENPQGQKRESRMTAESLKNLSFEDLKKIAPEELKRKMDEAISTLIIEVEGEIDGERGGDVSTDFPTGKKSIYVSKLNKVYSRFDNFFEKVIRKIDSLSLTAEDREDIINEFGNKVERLESLVGKGNSRGEFKTQEEGIKILKEKLRERTDQ